MMLFASIFLARKQPFYKSHIAGQNSPPKNVYRHMSRRDMALVGWHKKGKRQREIV